jgi:hypothetical protein
VPKWTVVDGQGRIGTSIVQHTISALDGAMSEQECVEFLVANCGFGAVRQLDRNIEVRFRPSELAQATFDGLATLLHERHWQRAVAAMFTGGTWQHEVLPRNREVAFERIKAIVVHHQLRMSEKVLRQARPLHAIPRGSPMGWVYQVWQRRPRLTASHDLRRSLAEETRGRYAWIDVIGPRCELIMSEVGSGFPASVCAALNPGLGNRVEDQPDNAFGRYCAEAYGAIADSGEPVLEDVDAIMTPPGREPVRRRYSRLILPFRSVGGHVRLLGLSFENLAIDLRRRAS